MLIPAEDYNRIFCTIYSLLLSQDADLEHSCITFSVIGSLLLRKHHQIKSSVCMGMAAYMMDGANKTVLAFAERVADRHISSTTGFHSWVEAGDFVIDFTAPLFPRMVKNNIQESTCTPKMFQKSVTEMATSPRHLEMTGDFFLSANVELTNNLIDAFVGNPANIDLVNICSEWYQKHPLEMLKVIPLYDAFGKKKNVRLQSFNIGTW